MQFELRIKSSGIKLSILYYLLGVAEGPMDVFDDDFDEEMIRAVEDVHGPILDDLYMTTFQKKK